MQHVESGGAGVTVDGGFALDCGGIGEEGGRRYGGSGRVTRGAIFADADLDLGVLGVGLGAVECCCPEYLKKARTYS